MFTGKIGAWARATAPSVEDKINRFAGQEQPPDFPGARGPDDPRNLSQRHFHQPAVRHPVRPGARIRGWSAPTSCALATPSNTTISTPRALKAASRPSGRSRAVLRLARSTAPLATRRLRPRACLPGSTPRCSAGRCAPGCRAAMRPTWACWWTTSSPGRDRALPHVYQPGRVPPAAARGQRRHAPDRSRAQDGLGGRCPLGCFQSQA